jgi:hypothetical protein
MIIRNPSSADEIQQRNALLQKTMRAGLPPDPVADEYPLVLSPRNTVTVCLRTM